MFYTFIVGFLLANYVSIERFTPFFGGVDSQKKTCIFYQDARYLWVNCERKRIRSPAFTTPGPASDGSMAT